MITEIKIGDILQSDCQTLVNTVNTVGVMGKGIALEFKKQFPEMYKDYKKRCDNGEVHLGKPYIYQQLFGPWIMNFPTKEHWRSIAKVEDIESGLQYIVKRYEAWEIESLAIPPLGCGNGQLEWKLVGPLIYKYMNPIDIPVIMYAPFGTSPNKLTREYLENQQQDQKAITHRENSVLNTNWLVLVEILHELEKNPYNPKVGRTIFQKISYFATEYGVPTNFNFQQKSYGPFSSDVKEAMTILANNGLLVEERKGKFFHIKSGQRYKQVRAKYEALFKKYQEQINTICDLFARMDTNQAELTSTIYFSERQIRKAEDSDNPTEMDVFRYVMEWKKRRRPPLDKHEVATAIRNLVMLDVLNLQYSKDLPAYDEV